MSERSTLRAEAEARRGWTSNFVRALLEQAGKSARPCAHKWRNPTDGLIICLKCGQTRTISVREDTQ